MDFCKWAISEKKQAAGFEDILFWKPAWNFSFFHFTPGNSRHSKAPPLEIPRPKTKTLGNSTLFLINPWKFHKLFYPWKFHILTPPCFFFFWNSPIKFLYQNVRPLLVESSVIVIFYMIFFICYAVIINNYQLFWKNFLQLRENVEGKQ